MGGGDLNLKKSWHPHTMKNQEKVWKAEQAKTQEENKLNDLRREIEEEKNREDLKRIGRESGLLGGSNEGDKKLDWMYKNSTDLINREEYLLGRKIDKSFEILQAEEEYKDQQNLVGVKKSVNHVEHECVPFSIRAYKNVQNTEQVDLQRKVMEDPLMLIKQREMESRKKILENPVKLKELHRILKTEKLHKISKKSKKSKKEKKSKRKNKKRNRSSSFESNSNTDSDSDIDRKLAKKLKVGLLDKDEVSDMGLNLTKLLDSKFEKISKELDKAAGKTKRKYKKKKSKYDKSETNSSADEQKNNQQRYRKSRSVSRDDKIKFNKCDESRLKSHEKRDEKEILYQNFNLVSGSRDKNKYNRGRTTYVDNRKRYRSVSRHRVDKFNNRSKSRSRSRSRGQRNARKIYQYTSSSSKGNQKSKKRNSSSRSRSRSQNKSSRSKSPPQNNFNHSDELLNRSPNLSTMSRRKKLSKDEKEAKLREMMSNAAWREEERTKVVRKHRETCAQEEEHQKTREFDKNFLNKEVKKAIDNQTSVGSRLRANLNNIQRTSAAMNLNFARK